MPRMDRAPIPSPLRSPHPAEGSSPDSHRPRSADTPRLNVLLSSSDWQDETWADHLPRLLQPLGVTALRVHSGREATRILQQHPIHIAVVDLALPIDHDHRHAPAANPTPGEGGHRLLELLARERAAAPTVVIKRRKSQREDAREITRVLSSGAFAVLERPVQLEILLQTLHRALRRFYHDAWPHPDTTPPDPDQRPPRFPFGKPPSSFA